ncbi:MAG: NAD(P)/FAD-dependent oxidoreductase, partial [Mycobacterium sp.]|nr:NAD(P)/FAD-dependent oxidoreductase [Mycobacterium sp.]
MDVTVVGSGPNGLSAAVLCARAGLRVQVFEAQPTLGGGARPLPDPEFPDVRHDLCSAIHPLAVASGFFAEFDLPARGVQLVTPEVSYANPLPGRPAVLAYRDLERTCAGLSDGASWRQLLGPLVDHGADVVALLIGDKRSPPPDLRAGAVVLRRMLEQGTPAWGRLRGQDAQALFTGVAAHTIARMPSLVAAGAGLLLATLGHTAGWPVPAGGSQAIADALMADLRAHGGVLHAGTEVTSPPSGVVLYDTAPTALLDIYGSALPPRYARALRRYRYGAGVAKVDFVLAQDIPWTDERLAAVPTLHLGGGRAQMARAEAEVARGRHAQWPMILAAQPWVADPGRIDALGRRPFWTYAHVPAGSTVDQAGVITEVMERFAPGFADVVVATRSIPAARMAGHDANYVGG